eukprot:scaffold419480_cov28-Prasinocladus_malaysianus.AAC.2
MNEKVQYSLSCKSCWRSAVAAKPDGTFSLYIGMRTTRSKIATAEDSCSVEVEQTMHNNNMLGLWAHCIIPPLARSSYFLGSRCSAIPRRGGGLLPGSKAGS